jgi:hypothetical protein
MSGSVISPNEPNNIRPDKTPSAFFCIYILNSNCGSRPDKFVINRFQHKEGSERVQRGFREGLERVRRGQPLPTPFQPSLKSLRLRCIPRWNKPEPERKAGCYIYILLYLLKLSVLCGIIKKVGRKSPSTMITNRAKDSFL